MSQVTVRTKEGADPLEFEVDIPEVDEENPQAFIDWASEALREEGDRDDEGLTVLCYNARQSMVVGVQAYIRSRYKKVESKDISLEELRNNVLDWKPVGRRPAKSAVEKGIDLFDNMSDDEKAAFIARLKSSSGR